MEDRLILYRQRRERRQEYKELAAKSCYSVMIVMIALVVLRPLMVDQILGRANAYWAVGRLDESERQCDKALLIDDNNSSAWCLLARIYKVRGDREMAYGAYERAVQADSANGSAHFELAMMYMDDGRYPVAIPHLEQVRRLGPDKAKGGWSGRNSYHQASLYMLALCYEKAGDPTKTELTLKEIRVFYPDCGNPEDHLAPLRANRLAR
jgi:tetratricopeptide (TPR) repeat protein